MAEIKRTTLFGKLNSLGYKSIEGATIFCKMRGNPYVETVHWLHQLLQNPDTDVHRIIKHFQLDASRLASDLVAALDKLPRGATATDEATNTSESSACVPVAPVAPPPPYLTGVRRVPSGAIQLAFTNASAASFTVLASTNVSLPSSNWIALGSPMPIGGGIYQFTDPNATNHPTRFYQLRWP
jgi:hypothetical protein